MHLLIVSSGELSRHEPPRCDISGRNNPRFLRLLLLAAGRPSCIQRYKGGFRR